MAFDIDGARKAGYSEAEIADHLAKSSKFDAAAARKAGYSDAEILQHLAAPQATAPKADGGESRIDRLTSPAGREMVKGEVMAFASPLRGLKDVVDTGAELLAKGYDKLTGSNEAAGVKAENDAGKREYEAATSGSFVAPVGRVTGNVVATAPAGAVLAAPVRALAATRVASPTLSKVATALESGGFSTGAPVARNMLGRAGDMGIRMGGGAVTGGVSAAMIDPQSIGMGAGVGAALPPVARIFGAGGNALASLTPAGGQRRAVERIANVLGDDTTQAIGDIQTYYPRGAETIPVSAPAIVRNPELARMEQASRLRNAPAWYEFDQRQGGEVFNNLLRATTEAEELAARKGAKDANWNTNWAAAASNIKPRNFVKRMGQLGSDIEQALASPEASNPAVRNMLEAIKADVIRVGPSYSPAHLQQIRANLSGKYDPQSPNAFAAAPRDSVAVRSVISEIDSILNHSTGGKWQKVLEGYAKDSGSVRASKAAGKVREAFVDPETGRVRGVSLDPNGDVAKVTEAGLGRAIDAARLPDKSLALSEPALQRLEATLEALRRQNIVQGVKRSSTAGGGSDTVSNALSIGAETVAPSGVTGTLLRELLAGGRRLATGRVDDATANLLMSPDDLALALEALAARQPNQLAAAPYRAAPALTAERR